MHIVKIIGSHRGGFFFGRSFNQVAFFHGGHGGSQMGFVLGFLALFLILAVVVGLFRSKS